jgi:hypothetical protein
MVEQILLVRCNGLDPDSPGEAPQALVAADLVGTPNTPTAGGASINEKSNSDPSSCPREILQKRSASIEEVQRDSGCQPLRVERYEEDHKEDIWENEMKSRGQLQKRTNNLNCFVLK